MVLLLGTSQKASYQWRLPCVYKPMSNLLFEWCGTLFAPQQTSPQTKDHNLHPVTAEATDPFFRTAVHTLYGTRLPEITIRKTFDTGSNRAHLSSSRPIPSALIPLVGNNGEFTTYTYLHIGKILSTLSLSPHGFALGHLPKGLSPMKTTHVYINPCPTSCLSDVGLCLHPNSSSMLWFSESYFQS